MELPPKWLSVQERMNREPPEIKVNDRGYGSNAVQFSYFQECSVAELID
jgi:hypothetical protein